MKNYTGLQKIKASEVIDTFKEEVVTEETFAEKVAKGYLYKGFEPPENATMLKFRYYSPEKVLIEQNNIPVVYDGTSITDVINYYYLTDKSSGVTFDYATKDSYGWTTGIQTVTKDKRFLWSVTETRYSNTIDGQPGTLTEPCIISIYGEKGERGAIYLGHYTDNQACYEANKPAVFSGDYYLNTTDSYIYTYDDESNKWAKISDYADYRYSIAMNDIIGALQDTKLTNFITAKTGWFENLAVGILRSQKLFSKEITLTDGGLIQSDGFQSGKSGWQIDYNGKAEFNDTTVRGKIYASDGEFKGAIKGGNININDNFIVTSIGLMTVKQGIFLNDCEFKGNIYSGPLELSDSKVNGATITHAKGTQITAMSGSNVIGLFNGYSFSSFNITVNEFLQKGTSFTILQYYGRIQLYDDFNNLIYTFTSSYYNNKKEILFPSDFTYTTIISDKAKTFKLTNLPTAKADTEGIVYKDSDGYLRIS